MPISDHTGPLPTAARNGGALELAAGIFDLLDNDPASPRVDRVHVYIDLLSAADEETGRHTDGHPIVAVNLLGPDGTYVDPSRAIEVEIDTLRDAFAQSGAFDGLTIDELDAQTWEFFRPHGPAVTAFIELDGIDKTSPTVDLSAALSQLDAADLAFIEADGWATGSELWWACDFHPELVRYIEMGHELDTPWRVCIDPVEADAWLTANRAATGLPTDRRGAGEGMAERPDHLRRKRTVRALAERMGVSKRQAADWYDPAGAPEEARAAIADLDG